VCSGAFIAEEGDGVGQKGSGETTILIFTLFSFQLDTLTILYIYNLGSFIYLYMFRIQSNTNGRPRQTTTEETVPEAACAIKAFDLLMMDRTVRNI
jgi:hypothetical protein